jgi:hypothetical protein
MTRVALVVMISIGAWRPVLAADIYIAQSSVGAADGSSCVNARALTYLNTAANWGGGGAEIDPGDTVILCGTITGGITLAGSGSAGNPVVIDSTSATQGAAANLDTNSKSYVTLKNFVHADGATAFITLSGDHIIIDGWSEGNTTGGIFIVAGSTNMTVRNSYIQQTTVDQGAQFDVLSTEGVNGLILEGNYFINRSRGTCVSCHDDTVQTFCRSNNCAITANIPQNLTIRYNLFVMDTTVAGDKSILQMESMQGTNYVYGNVFYGIQGAGNANGMVHYSASGTITWHWYNNTTYVASGLENTIRFLNTGTLNFKNNITSSPAGTVYSSAMTTTRTFNNWFGSNAPGCTGTGEVCSNPLFTNQATGVLSLTGSSPGKGTGTVIANLGGQTFDVGVTHAATWPNPSLETRNASTWDMGAFCETSCTGGSAPAVGPSRKLRFLIRDAPLAAALPWSLVVGWRLMRRRRTRFV